jgi:hypothetical protein
LAHRRRDAFADEPAKAGVVVGECAAAPGPAKRCVCAGVILAWLSGSAGN